MENTWWTQPEQLDDDQKKIVALPKDGNHLIVGPPGSGKTNLLILRATYLHRSKVQNIAVITFQRVLKEFLASGSTNYAFSPDKIQTFMRWGIKVLTDNGVKFEEQGDFPATRKWLVDQMEQIVKLGKPENVFDCILLDEAQDYSPREIEIFRAFSNQLFAVGDNSQNIYDVAGALDCLGKYCTTSELKYHYRNGQKICRVADGIRNLLDMPNGMEASSNYDDHAFPSSVNAISCSTLMEQVEKAIPEIETQLKAYPGGMIGVLCPIGKDVDAVWAAIAKSLIAPSAQLQRYEDGYEQFDPSRRVVVTTMHGAKGLEFRALHLMGMDKIKKFPKQKNMSYTGVTRAKTSLAIYHVGSLPGYLEKGVSAISHLEAEPTLSDLFKL